MSMEVAIQTKSVEIMQDKSFCLIDRGLEFFFWMFPAAVQVTTGKGASIISVDHTVGV
jgi:hypothetical protein